MGLFRKKPTEPARRHARASELDASPYRGDAGFDMVSYRRGTTLSSFKSDEPGKTERQRLKQLRQLRRRMAAVLAVIIILAIFGFALLMQYSSNISGATAGKDIKLTETDIKKYEDIVNEYMAKNSFERFDFARRSSVLEQYVESKAPEVSSARLSTSGIMSSKIVLKFRRPVAMWVSGDKVSFVDDKGIVFERNYFEAPAISIQDDSGIAVGNGVATSASFLSFIGKTAVEIEKINGLKIDRVVIPKGSARYVEIYLTGRNYPFKAQISRDAASQASDIAVMVRYLDAHNIVPQYVDCRVVGKAFWK